MLMIPLPLEKFKRQEQPLYFKVLFLLVIFEGAFFTFYGVSRHYNYLTSINDLGCFDQAIWGILHGTPFLNTIVFSKAVNWLGFHFHPVLVLFVPFYLVSPDVLWLILAQSVALPLAALPIYCLARQLTRSDLAAFFWSLTYLLTPFILSAASWDFHPVTLAVPFVALACLALVQERFRLLLLSCLFILLCKEHFGLMVFGFGLLWFIRRREFWPSFTLVLVGIGHFLLLFSLVMPMFSPTEGHSMLAEGVSQLSRYNWLGSSFSGIILTIINRPIDTGYHALFMMEGWKYLIIIFLPLCCLPFLGLEFLLPAMGDIMANLLSANPMPRSAFAYHSVAIVPILITSAIIGSYRFRRIVKIAAPERQAFIVLTVTIIISWTSFPFFPLPGSFPVWEPQRVLIYRDENYATVQGLIDTEMTLSVQANIGAHFTQRNEVYAYPNKIGNVDAVILYLDSPTALLRVNAPYQIGSLGHHLQMEPKTYLESIRQVLLSDIYPRIYWKDPWLILMKGKKNSESKQNIIYKIDELKVKWRL